MKETKRVEIIKKRKDMETLKKLRIKHEFQKELTQLINKHSMENYSNTPDFILSEYLVECLQNFGDTVNKLKQWEKE